MFVNRWLIDFVQLLVLVPSAISCYLPAKNQMKLSMNQAAVLCCVILIPFAFIASYVSSAFGLNINIVVLPVMIIFSFCTD